MVAIAVVNELTLLSTENVAMVLKELGSIGFGLAEEATGTHSNPATNSQKQRMGFSFRFLSGNRCAYLIACAPHAPGKLPSACFSCQHTGSSTCHTRIVRFETEIWD
jgi:hypothetical protein